ncbi:MAG: formate dehydrogenase accessory sulfurtransferase FdhD [Methanocorpusculum sp.]|nr:formate dehydrogenase accessory sulfurtransferase FdhD [Methanocorpusculum sp.]
MGEFHNGWGKPCGLAILDEKLYSLTVNGRALASVMLLPGGEKEFAYGYLTTEGVLDTKEIESVMVEPPTIGVLTANPFKVLLPKKSVISGCGGTASYLDPEKLPTVKAAGDAPAFSVSFDSPVVRAGGFAAAVATPERVFSAVELSQSTAIDKAVGAAVLGGFLPEQAAIVLSGKVTGDFVRKALKAGIPYLYSGFPPTTLAVSAAKIGGLTLRPLGACRR